MSQVIHMYIKFGCYLRDKFNTNYTQLHLLPYRNIFNISDIFSGVVSVRFLPAVPRVQLTTRVYSRRRA